MARHQEIADSFDSLAASGNVAGMLMLVDNLIEEIDHEGSDFGVRFVRILALIPALEWLNKKSDAEFWKIQLREIAAQRQPDTQRRYEAMMSHATDNDKTEMKIADVVAANFLRAINGTERDIESFIADLQQSIDVGNLSVENKRIHLHLVATCLLKLGRTDEAAKFKSTADSMKRTN